jgi:hypothetical protein
VYTRVPAHVKGSGVFTTTGPVGVSVSPQLLITTGGVGTVMLAGQDTVAKPFAGTVKSFLSIV